MSTAREDRAELSDTWLTGDDKEARRELFALCNRLIDEKAAAESGALVSVPVEDLERLRDAAVKFGDMGRVAKKALDDCEAKDAEIDRLRAEVEWLRASIVALELRHGA